MIRDAGGPLSRNQELFAGNTDGPTREIVSELCGVGRTAVGKYLKEHKESGGVMRSAFPRGSAKKGPREIAPKSDMPGGGAPYDTIPGRIPAVRREGRVNTARNLLRYLTVAENGPKPPGVSVRVSRRKLRPMSLFPAKTKKVLTSERSKPYVGRWVVRYCRRRADQLKGGLPTRPRIWLDGCDFC